MTKEEFDHETNTGGVKDYFYATVLYVTANLGHEVRYFKFDKPYNVKITDFFAQEKSWSVQAINII